MFFSSAVSVPSCFSYVLVSTFTFYSVGYIGGSAVSFAVVVAYHTIFMVGAFLMGEWVGFLENILDAISCCFYYFDFEVRFLDFSFHGFLEV